MTDLTDVTIIGAGPYGLSITAHLRKLGLAYRIVVSPMESWKSKNLTVEQTKAQYTRFVGTIRAAFERQAIFFKNSSAMAGTSIVSAIFGFMFWWLAARSFAPEVIGKASAFFSLMAFIGLIGDGGLGTLLIVDIVRWRGREPGLISSTTLVSLGLSLIGGVIGLIATELLSTLQLNWIDNLLFLIGCGLHGFLCPVDAAFVGMLQPTFRMLRQFSFNFCRVILIPVTAVLFSDTTALLFVWIIALTSSLVIIELSLRRFGRSLIHKPDFKLLWTLRRKTIDYYLLDVGNVAPAMIMPYLVAVLLSPASNAAFTMIWMIVGVALVIPGSVATVLLPVIKSEPSQYREKMVLSFGASLLYATIFASFIFLFSKETLAIFNPAFAEIGQEHLRLLGFGMFGAVIKSHVCTVARLTNSMRRMSLWFCITGMLELVCVVVGAWVGALEGVAIGWTIAMMVEGGMLLLLLNPLGNQNTVTDISR